MWIRNMIFTWKSIRSKNLETLGVEERNQLTIKAEIEQEE